MAPVTASAPACAARTQSANLNRRFGDAVPQHLLRAFPRTPKKAEANTGDILRSKGPVGLIWFNQLGCFLQGERANFEIVGQTTRLHPRLRARQPPKPQPAGEKQLIDSKPGNPTLNQHSLLKFSYSARIPAT